MKRLLLVGVLVAALLTVAAVTAIAAPGGPAQGWYGHMNGMMGQGGWGYGHMGGYGMMGAQGVPGTMMGDDLEKLLGISHADIHAAHVAGKSLVEIAAEKDVSEEQLVKALLDGRKAALDQAVKAGALTQVAADRMYQFMADNIKAMVEAKGIQGMMGNFRGYGMMGRYGPNGSTGPCHGNQAPEGTGVRSTPRLAPAWQQQS